MEHKHGRRRPGGSGDMLGGDQPSESEEAQEWTSSRGKKVSRVEGRDRVRLYAKHCDKFNRKAERARASIGQENYR